MACRYHILQVVYTRRVRDLLRKRYWVRCWDCDLEYGPYVARVTAAAAAGLVDALGAIEPE